ncbi:MAG: hypothetical protein R3275_13275 [Saprospiraceae bacterium]|nr:hypothetical protein [Saprospiraceae bacterium]
MGNISCNCIHLEKGSTTTDQSSSDTETYIYTCLLKHGGSSMNVIMTIGEAFTEKTGSKSTAKECPWVTDENVACSDCPMYKAG